MLSIVTHRLTVPGLTYFETWFDELRGVLELRTGFVAISVWADPEDAGARVVALEMKSDEATREWGASREKDRLLSKIAPYWVRPYEVRPADFVPSLTGTDASMTLGCPTTEATGRGVGTYGTRRGEWRTPLAPRHHWRAGLCLGPPFAVP